MDVKQLRDGDGGIRSHGPRNRPAILTTAVIIHSTTSPNPSLSAQILLMRDLQVNLIELDEQWDFIAKKQRHVKQGDAAETGHVWPFVALAATQNGRSKLRSRKAHGREHGSPRDGFARPHLESPANHV